MLKIQLLFKSLEDILISSLKWSKCSANSGSKSVSDPDCNIYWSTHNWSKAQRRKDTEVMQKQDDVKSQTNGPFALTLQGIKGYGQLNQQQCWTTRLTVKQSSVLKEKKNWLACHYMCSNPMQIWWKKILCTIIPCKSKKVLNSCLGLWGVSPCAFFIVYSVIP